MHPAYIALFVLLAVIFLIAVWVKIRVLHRAKRRPGLTEEQFVGALGAKGIPKEIGRAVFAGFRKWGSCISDDFPITPELPLRDFVPWVEHDEVDIIHEVLTETGRHWPPKQLLPCSPDWTLADVAKFVAECPRVV
jgi:hypothetical protein